MGFNELMESEGIFLVMLTFPLDVVALVRNPLVIINFRSGLMGEGKNYRLRQW